MYCIIIQQLSIAYKSLIRLYCGIEGKSEVQVHVPQTPKQRVWQIECCICTRAASALCDDSQIDVSRQFSEAQVAVLSSSRKCEFFSQKVEQQIVNCETPWFTRQDSQRANFGKWHMRCST